MRATEKALAIMKALASRKTPMGSQTICDKIPIYISYCSSNTKYCSPVLRRFVELGYAERVERGQYKATASGRMLAKLNSKRKK